MLRPSCLVLGGWIHWQQAQAAGLVAEDPAVQTAHISLEGWAESGISLEGWAHLPRGMGWAEDPVQTAHISHNDETTSEPIEYDRGDAVVVPRKVRVPANGADFLQLGPHNSCTGPTIQLLDGEDASRWMDEFGLRLQRADSMPPSSDFSIYRPRDGRAGRVVRRGGGGATHATEMDLAESRLGVREVAIMDLCLVPGTLKGKVVCGSLIG